IRWTGKQFVSLSLPEINLKKVVREGTDLKKWEQAMDGNENVVVIQQGELLAGQLCKATLGNVPRGIVQQIYLRFGSEALVRFHSDIQRALIIFMERKGLSVGLDDVEPPKRELQIIESQLQNLHQRIQ